LPYHFTLNAFRALYSAFLAFQYIMSHNGSNIPRCQPHLSKRNACGVSGCARMGNPEFKNYAAYTLHPAFRNLPALFTVKAFIFTTRPPGCERRGEGLLFPFRYRIKKVKIAPFRCAPLCNFPKSFTPPFFTPPYPAIKNPL
jgi:hypothetical protein